MALKFVNYFGYPTNPFTILEPQNRKGKSLFESAADVKKKIPVLLCSPKSSILSSTSFQLDKTFWGVGSVAVGIEQSGRKDNMVAQGDGKFGP